MKMLSKFASMLAVLGVPLFRSHQANFSRVREEAGTTDPFPQTIKRNSQLAYHEREKRKFTAVELYGKKKNRNSRIHKKVSRCGPPTGI